MDPPRSGRPRCSSASSSESAEAGGATGRGPIRAGGGSAGRTQPRPPGAGRAGGVRAAGVVTQNVDGLHQAAGSTRVVNLHGEIAWVVCLDCERLPPVRCPGPAGHLNPELPAPTYSPGTPSSPRRGRGGRAMARFPAGGMPPLWRPAQTGRGVLRRVGAQTAGRAGLRAGRRGRGAGGLGSSLTVMSGLRFVRHHAKHGTARSSSSMWVTQGPLATLKLDPGLLGDLGRAIADLGDGRGCRRTPEVAAEALSKKPPPPSPPPTSPPPKSPPPSPPPYPRCPRRR